MLHSSIEVALPAHIAIVMDGNGRWAEVRGETRAAGHRAGLEPVRGIIRECTRLGVQALTLFAFSSENWRRPEIEVAAIMGLFMEALEREVEELHANGVRLRVIGNRQRLSVRLQQRIAELLSEREQSQQVQVVFRRHHHYHDACCCETYHPPQVFDTFRERARASLQKSAVERKEGQLAVGEADSVALTEGVKETVEHSVGTGERDDDVVREGRSD